MTTKFSQSAAYSVQRKSTVVSRIIRLLKPCFPSAILLGIAFVIVDPSQCHFRCGPLTHVSKKVLKGHPAITNRNSAPTIVFVASILIVQTPSFHFHPVLIGRTFSHSVRNTFALRAGFGPSSLQVGIVANGLASTDAPTNAECLPMAARGVRDNCELAEGASDDGFFWWHNGNFIFASGTRPTLIGVCCDSAENPVWTEG